MAWFEGEVPAHMIRSPFADPECYLSRELFVFGSVEIGRFTYICGSSIIGALSKVTIGSFCSIAKGFHCVTQEDAPTCFASTFPLREVVGVPVQQGPMSGMDFADFIDVPKPVTVGNDVWIGDSVTLMGGATIGHGCVIGAKSVVHGKCVPYGIYAGNPARLIRMRFPEEVVRSLLELRWWDWPADRIKRNARFFENDLSKCSGDLEELVAA